MPKYKRTSKGKEIKPTFFVFCEGESEDAYVGFLKTQYRIPIEISSKVAGNRINKKYIDNALQGKPRHSKDRIFLIYDIDVPDMLPKLTDIKNTTLLASNPCFELWYILHTVNQTTALNTDECIEKNTKLYKGYHKGELDNTMKEKLTTSVAKATERAQKLTPYNNPSTTVYLLVEALENVKKRI